MPGMFVILWSTAFVGAKYGLTYAEPLTFLLLPFVFVVAMMLPLALAMRAVWPRSIAQFAHVAVVGVLMHAGALGGTFCSIHLGMSAGVGALIVGIQPILTAFASAPLFGERLPSRQWFGLVLGFGGVLLVVSGRSALSGITPMTLALLALVFETMQVRWTGQFMLTLAWLVLVVSIGAVSLLYILIRKGAATTVVSLFILFHQSQR